VFGLWRREVRRELDVSEEHIACIVRVEEYVKPAEVCDCTANALKGYDGAALPK
jgi:hypothetical protein